MKSDNSRAIFMVTVAVVLIIVGIIVANVFFKYVLGIDLAKLPVGVRSFAHLIVVALVSYGLLKFFSRGGN